MVRAASGAMRERDGTFNLSKHDASTRTAPGAAHRRRRTASLPESSTTSPRAPRPCRLQRGEVRGLGALGVAVSAALHAAGDDLVRAPPPPVDPSRLDPKTKDRLASASEPERARSNDHGL